jgi:hypothetical protein
MRHADQICRALRPCAQAKCKTWDLQAHGQLLAPASEGRVALSIRSNIECRIHLRTLLLDGTGKSSRAGRRTWWFGRWPFSTTSQWFGGIAV